MKEIKDFQAEVKTWSEECFGEEIVADKKLRNHRFLEEALELVQSLGCTCEEADRLVTYVFSRPKGAPLQELGGTLVTLATLSNANGFSMEGAATKELENIWMNINKIREKSKNKPKF